MQQVPQHVVEAFAQLNQKLAPAKLKSTPINGAIIAEWLKTEDGIDMYRTATYVLAGAMYEAIKRHIHDGKLYWDVKPAVLKPRVKVVDNPLKREEERRQRQKEMDAAAAQSKDDVAALNSINGMIEGVCITTNGRVQYGKTDEVKVALRTYRDKQVKAGVPLRTLEKKVRNVIEKVYEAVEKGQAYSTTCAGA